MQADNNTHIHAASTKTLLLIVLVCFVSLIVLLIFAGQPSALAFDDKKMLVMQNSTVEVMPVKLQPSYLKPRTVYGRLESLKESDLGFELTGLLNEVYVTEGQTVTKGQPLAGLDRARLNARQNELKSSLESAKANAKLAKLSADRISDLVSRKLEPQQLFDESIANLDAANARVAEAKARLESLTVELEKSTLYAPFDGQIITQHLDEGTVVNAGQGIFTLLEIGLLEARFGLPEQTAHKLYLGQEISIVANNISLPATVKSVSNQRVFSTRTIEAVLTIDHEALLNQVKLVSGDLVSLSIDIPIDVKGAWVPLSSLASAVRGLWTVYVLNQQQMVEKRLVSVEFANNEFAYITGAIEEGDRLIVSGIHRLAPEQYVENVREVSFQPEKFSQVDIIHSFNSDDQLVRKKNNETQNNAYMEVQ